MALWIGALAQGFAYAGLAWAVFLSLRTLRFPDITVDGTFALGAALAAVWAARGGSPFVALFVGAAAGALAGSITGLVHAWFQVPDLLSGILKMTALYSITLHVLGGRSNLAIERAALEGMLKPVGIEGEWAELLGTAGLMGGVSVLLVLFLRTDYGLALRAAGENEAMARANGFDPYAAKTVGLAISNGLAALAGALIGQTQGFADVTMGIGSLVAGIAALVLGERLLKRGGAVAGVMAALVGSILFRLLLAGALRLGMPPMDLKLVTAAFVLLGVAWPTIRARFAR